jgi:hypothetical protein
MNKRVAVFRDRGSVLVSFPTILDYGDNAHKLTGNGFRDLFERRISNMLHGDRWVDGGYLDVTASEILYDHIARQH